MQMHKGEFPPKVRLVEYMDLKKLCLVYYTAAVWVSQLSFDSLLESGTGKRFGQYYIQIWHGSFGIKRSKKTVIV